MIQRQEMGRGTNWGTEGDKTLSKGRTRTSRRVEGQGYTKG